MKRNWMRCLAIAALAGTLAAGCGQKKDEGAAAEAAAPVVRLTPAEEAQAAVQTTIADLKAGRLDAVYGALPASYRADVEGLVKAYAEKIDRDLYTRSASLVASAADFLTAQADNLASLCATDPNLDVDLPGGLETDDLTAGQIRSAAAWLGELARTLSYDDLARGDITPLLSSPRLAEVVGELVALLPADFLSCGAAPAEGESLPEGMVSLALSAHFEADEETETEEVQFVKLDGKWIPVDLMQGWRDMMATAREAVAGFEVDAAGKQFAERLFPVIERSLDTLKTARTPEELEAQAFGAFMTVGMMAGTALGE